MRRGEEGRGGNGKERERRGGKGRGVGGRDEIVLDV